MQGSDVVLSLLDINGLRFLGRVPKTDGLVEAHRDEEVIELWLIGHLRDAYIWVEADLGRHIRVLEDLNMSLFVEVPKNDLAVEAASEQLVWLLLVAAPGNVQDVVFMLSILPEWQTVEHLVYLRHLLSKELRIIGLNLELRVILIDLPDLEHRIFATSG